MKNTSSGADFSDKPKLFSDKPDLTLMICSILCAAIGILTVNSASASLSAHGRYIFMQSAAAVIGLCAMAAMIFFRYTNLKKIKYFIFGAAIAALAAVLVIGKLSHGMQGWIKIGAFSFQPSELAKLCFIITLAAHLSEVWDSLRSPKTLLLLLLHFLCYTIPVLLQPDFGTAAVFGVIFIFELFFAGISLKLLGITFGGLAALSPIVWFFLRDFQKKRIITLFRPESDPLGSGYHVIQSKIAIGSGQLTGRGYMHGPQTQFGYLPERQTDFVFSVIGEEFGFIGTITVTVLLFIIIYRCFESARNNSHDPFGSLMCAGVGAMLFFHVVENIGMCIGLMPVTGIPLPFISYGGSSLITCFASVGLVQSVTMRRRSVKFNI